MKNNNSYLIRLFIFGIITTVLSFFFLRTALTFKFSLTELKGIPGNANTYINTVTHKGHSSQKSELIFYIRGKDKEFELARNIGTEFIDMEYEDMRLAIKKAKSISVWIRKSDEDEFRPEVFQIAADNSILLDHETVRADKAPGAFLLLIMGLGSLTICILMWFPKLIRSKN